MRYLALVFCLVLAESTLASPVNPTAPNGIASLVTENITGGSNGYILDSVGQTWICRSSGVQSGWILFGQDVPVPLNEIADWNVKAIVTYDGRIYLGTLNPNAPSFWQLLPPFTEDPVSEESGTLGNVKSLFR